MFSQSCVQVCASLPSISKLAVSIFDSVHRSVSQVARVGLWVRVHKDTTDSYSADVTRYCSFVPGTVAWHTESYQREGQPRMTESEFSHNRLAMIQPRIGRSRKIQDGCILCILNKRYAQRVTMSQCYQIFAYNAVFDSNVENVTFPASLKGLILEHRLLSSKDEPALFTK